MKYKTKKVISQNFLIIFVSIIFGVYFMNQSTHDMGRIWALMIGNVDERKTDYCWIKKNWLLSTNMVLHI